MTDEIHIADAYENNLKHVSLTIPKGKLVVFAGVSGSGEVVFTGTPRDRLSCPASKTAHWLQKSSV